MNSEKDNSNSQNKIGGNNFLKTNTPTIILEHSAKYNFNYWVLLVHTVLKAADIVSFYFQKSWGAQRLEFPTYMKPTAHLGWKDMELKNKLA